MVISVIAARFLWRAAFWYSPAAPGMSPVWWAVAGAAVVGNMYGKQEEPLKNRNK